jgi:hypothetical protein
VKSAARLYPKPAGLTERLLPWLADRGGWWCAPSLLVRGMEGKTGAATRLYSTHLDATP